MRYSVLILLFLYLFPFLAQNVRTACYTRSCLRIKGVLIRDIEMEGFVLGDKEPICQIFKPYRNKYLTKLIWTRSFKRSKLFMKEKGISSWYRSPIK